MIKADKGRIKLVGKTNTILAELAMIVPSVYVHTLTKEKGNTHEAVHAAIMEAVRLGLDMVEKADVEVVDADSKTDDEVVELLEEIRDFLKEANDADDYD